MRKQNKTPNVQAAEPLPPAPCSAYWPLFKHMADNHGLTLLDSEMEDICQVVERMRGWQPKQGTYTRWICANCGAPIGRRYRVKTGTRFWTHIMSKGKAGHCCNCATPTPNVPN